MKNIDEITATMSRYRIVPVITINNPEEILPLGRALIENGLPIAEITFRTTAAEAAIRLAVKEYPEMLIGAGTIIRTEQADAALNAGAGFMVSPGFNPRICSYLAEKGCPIIPGINSPTQIEQALEAGFPILKFFPAEASGGQKMLKALCAPYPEVRFMPTGGINPGNICGYLSQKSVFACGGSWMLTESLIQSGNYEQIGKLTRDAVELTAGCDL